MAVERFIVRVYGFIHCDWKELLIAEEYHYDTFMRKFPGGGLEFGEGPRDCLQRELKEELNTALAIGDHLHTTGVFIQSAFREEHQVIGIYYLLEADRELLDRFREHPPLPAQNGMEQFRWVSVDKLSLTDITFPADRQAFEAFLFRKKSVTGQ